MAVERGININSIAPEQKYEYAEDRGAIYQGIFGQSGILNIAEKLDCTKYSNNEVRMASGDYINQGYQIRIPFGETRAFEIENGTIGQKRHDLIIAEFERVSQLKDAHSFKVIKGTSNATNPQDPVLTQQDLNAGGTLRQEALYRIVLDGIEITGIERVADYIDMQDAERLGGQPPEYYMPKANGTFTGNVKIQGSFLPTETGKYYVGDMYNKWNGIYTLAMTTDRLSLGDYAGIAYGTLYGLSGCVLTATTNLLLNTNQTFAGGIFPLSDGAFDLGSVYYRWNVLYCKQAPVISCDSAGKKLMGNVDFSDSTKRTRSAVGSIPVSKLRELIQGLEIREYKRYKNEVIDTAAEEKTFRRVLDEDSCELGIFIDDLKDNPLFEAIGRTNTDKDGNVTHSLNTMSYATIALVGAKDALNRLDAAEAKIAKQGALIENLTKRLEALEGK